MNRKTAKIIKEVKLKTGSIILEILREQGLSYREASALIFGNPDSYPQLHRIANGEGNPTLDTLILIFDKLNSLDRLKEILIIKN